jgi:hypothetical protein
VKAIADAMKKAGWNIVWTVHSTNTVRAMSGYEKNLADYLDTAATIF